MQEVLHIWVLVLLFPESNTCIIYSKLIFYFLQGHQGSINAIDWNVPRDDSKLLFKSSSTLLEHKYCKFFVYNDLKLSMKYNMLSHIWGAICHDNPKYAYALSTFYLRNIFYNNSIVLTSITTMP